MVGWDRLLWVARLGLCQSGLETLNIRFLVYLLNFDACFDQCGVTTLVGPQLAREKCIGGVVVEAIVHWR